MNAFVPHLAPASVDSRPLVVHLVYALGVGGLETLLVDCIKGWSRAKKIALVRAEYDALTADGRNEDAMDAAYGPRTNRKNHYFFDVLGVHPYSGISLATNPSGTWFHDSG